MRVLVTYGSKMGGTAGIAEMIGEALQGAGLEVDVRPAGDVADVARYDAVLVGAGLYANRWQRDARRFVKRHARDLRTKRVWFFSSGPLDDSPTKKDIPPTKQVQGLMQLVEARGHVTFGGRMPPDPPGFIARMVAKQLPQGDFRDPAQVRRWSLGIASELGARGEAPRAAPGPGTTTGGEAPPPP